MSPAARRPAGPTRDSDGPNQGHDSRPGAGRITRLSHGSGAGGSLRLGHRDAGRPGGALDNHDRHDHDHRDSNGYLSSRCPGEPPASEGPGRLGT